MSSKIPDKERGKPTGHIVSDPRWRCPSCKLPVSEPFAKNCRKCREARK